MSLTPKNWATFQHYKDRKPAWIKLHRGLLDDFAFASLPLASQALAPRLWLIASEYEDGRITASLDEIAFRVRCSKQDITEAIKPLISSGFFIDDSNTLAECKHNSILEEERETQEQTEKIIRADARDGENASRETIQSEPVESPSDPTASTELAEKLLPPPESARPPPRYAFESGIIRLNQANLDNWIKAFSYLDLRAELFSLTEWAQAQGPDRWFPAVSGALAKRNREVKIRIEREKTNPDPRKGTPFEAFA